MSITKLRLAAAGLLVSVGVGLGSILSPLVGSAAATAGQIVNVSDPVTANTARVSSDGKLAVGDGSGPLSVDGTVTGRPAAPAASWVASRAFMFPDHVIIAGPSSVPIDVTSLSISTAASNGSGLTLALWGTHVASSATTCVAAVFDATLWYIHDLGDGVTPLSFSFPTPLQWKPPANAKACLVAYGGSSLSSSTINAVGFYGG